MLAPLVHLLDPRPASEAAFCPIRDSVNIPWDEIGGRVSELPHPSVPVRVCEFGDCADRAEEVLRSRKRTVERTLQFQYGVTSPGRLWAPNPFLESCIKGPARGVALDVGCGVGRESVFLAATGYEVHALDHLPDALDRAKDLAARYAPSGRFRWLCQGAPEAMNTDQRYDLIVMFYYLDRDVLRAIPKLLNPGGSVIVETFHEEHRARFGKPKEDRLVLQTGELRELFSGLDVRHYDEGLHGDRYTSRLWCSASTLG